MAVLSAADAFAARLASWTEFRGCASVVVALLPDVCHFRCSAGVFLPELLVALGSFSLGPAALRTLGLAVCRSFLFGASVLVGSCFFRRADVSCAQRRTAICFLCLGQRLAVSWGAGHA